MQRIKEDVECVEKEVSKHFTYVNCVQSFTISLDMKSRQQIQYELSRSPSFSQNVFTL